MPDAPTRIGIKRAYQQACGDDGTRVLVDRMWPRGVSRQSAAIDTWFKDIAPSDGLRRWYGHETARWPEFRERYRRELQANTDKLNQLIELCRQGRVTLVFAARDEARSNAAVLQELLEEKLD